MTPQEQTKQNNIVRIQGRTGRFFERLRLWFSNRCRELTPLEILDIIINALQVIRAQMLTLDTDGVGINLGNEEED